MLYLLGIERKKVIVTNQPYKLQGVQLSWAPFLCFMKKLALGHAFNSRELFQNFPLGKLKLTKQQCLDIYPDGNKRDLAASIFVRSLELVVDDIIENNVQFKFPGLGSTQAYLQMKRTSGDDFKVAFKHGKWRAVDFIKSNFCGYALSLIMLSLKRPMREKPIYLSNIKTEKITEYTNQGKQY